MHKEDLKVDRFGMRIRIYAINEFLIVIYMCRLYYDAFNIELGGGGGGW